MYEKKQLVKSGLFLMGFWTLFFSIYQAGQYRVAEFAVPVIVIAFCMLAAMYAIFCANHSRSMADYKNWISKSAFLKQSMRLISERKALVRFGSWSQTLYEQHKPEEVSWDIVNLARAKIKGDYRKFFDEILSAFAGNLEVPAFIIPSSRENEFNKKSRHIEYEMKLARATGDEQEVLALKDELLELRQNTFEHDNRSLLKHSLLVLACAQKIHEYGGDPLAWASFKKLGLAHKADEVFLDPLLFICAFAHDIGKISAFNSATKSTVDHDLMGAKVISSLPSYMGSTGITARDRLILDTVLGNYHAPYRVNISINGSNLEVLDNRIHRILETLMLADKLAGKMEQAAYHDGRAGELSEEEWRGIVVKHVGATPTKKLSELDRQEKLELSESCVGAFISTLQEISFNDAAQGVAFSQFDYEAGVEYAYVSVPYIINLMEVKLGVLSFESQLAKETTYTDLLAREGKIVHPYNIDLCKNSWAWKFDVYERSKIINEELGDIAWGVIDSTQPLESQVGYFWIVDPEAFNFQFKQASKSYPHYFLLAGGMGNGVASAWVRQKKEIEAKRKERIVDAKSLVRVEAAESPIIIEGDIYTRVKQVKGLLGRGQKSDLAILASNGLSLQDIEGLSLDEQVLVGLSVQGGKLISVR